MKKSLEEDNEKTYNDTLQQAAWQKVLDNTKVKKYPEKDVKKIEGFSDLSVQVCCKKLITCHMMI